MIGEQQKLNMPACKRGVGLLEELPSVRYEAAQQLDELLINCA